MHGLSRFLQSSCQLRCQKWDTFANSEPVDHLIQLAILHAEFEALHPFLDGNGRMGRMFVPLYLSQAQLLHCPMFYISAYFEQHREEYYDRLLAVSRDGDWTGWCVFFLDAVREQAEENLSRTNDILGLYEELKNIVVELTHSQYSIHALDHIFGNPVFKGSDFTKRAGIPAPTARRILNLLRDDGLIRPVREARGRRSAIYMFPNLLNIAEGRRAF